MARIGVDFGGTKIEAAALGERGEFLSRVRAANPGDYDAAIQTVCALVDEVERAAGGRRAVGVGAPGSHSPRTGLIRNSSTVWLNGRNLAADLAKALGRPVRVANDANCLALSEVVDGAALGSLITFAVILGTGCGGGLVVNGNLLEGANGIAGEWGHTPVPDAERQEHDTPLCWCGRRGCLETLISGRGLERDYRGAAGVSRSGEQIVQLMRERDPVASAAFERFLERLARGLGVICNVIDPDTVVFGGGLSNVAEIYAALPAKIRPHVFADVWEARLVVARWGDSSGVRGAARLWPPDAA
jgi:fructokinase